MLDDIGVYPPWEKCVQQAQSTDMGHPQSSAVHLTRLVASLHGWKIHWVIVTYGVNTQWIDVLPVQMFVQGI